MDRLTAEFPQRSTQAITLHDHWLTRRRLFKDQVKCVLTTWHRDHTAANSWLLEALERVETRQQHQQSLEEKRKRQQDICQRLAAELEELQGQKNIRDATEAARVAELEQQRHREEEIRMRAEEKRRAQDRVQVEQYRARVRAAEEEVARVKEAQKQLELTQRAEQAPHHRARVELRSELLREKALIRQQKAQELQFQREELERRLDAIRREVVVEAKADPARLLQPTEATKGHMDTDLYQVDSRAKLFNVHGYSHDTLMKDPRHRLAMALQSKGISTTGDYARQAIAQVGSKQASQQNIQRNMAHSSIGGRF